VSFWLGARLDVTGMGCEYSGGGRGNSQRKAGAFLNCDGSDKTWASPLNE